MSAIAQFFGWLLIVGAIAVAIDIVSGSMPVRVLGLCVLPAGVGIAMIVWAHRRDAEEADARSDWLLGKNSWGFLFLLGLPGCVYVVKTLYAHELGRYVLGGLGVILSAVAVRAFRLRSEVPPYRIPRQLIVARLRKARTAEEFERLLHEFRNRAPRPGPGSMLWEADISKRAIKLGADGPALEAAIALGSKKTVEALISAGANINLTLASGKTPAQVAVRFGQPELLKVLLEHGAGLHGSKDSSDPSGEEIVSMLFAIGENALARDFGKAVTGVDLQAPDPELLEQGRQLESLFVAAAVRFKARGNHSSAQRLCEWQMQQWREDRFRFRDKFTFLLQISTCVRTLGEIKEEKGDLQSALRLYRNALGVLAFRGDEYGDFYEDAPAILDESEAAQILTMQARLDLSPAAEHRLEFAAVLQACERVLGKLDQPGEQANVSAALERLASLPPVTHEKDSRARGDDPDVVRAAELGKHETVKQLIALGARLDVEGCGRTDDSALMAAVRSGSKKTVEALISAGADVNRGIAHDDDRDYVWNDDWKTPFKVAALCGNHDILKLLLDRGARPPDLRSPFDSGVEEGILMLFVIGEDGLARNLGRVAAGVELPQPDAERLERARFLGSVIAAFAEWFNARGDRFSAKRLCEWKIERWRVGQVQDDWDRLPMEMAACVRTLAEICESEGKTQEALRHCRTALRVWRINNLEDVAPLVAGSVLDHVHFGVQALTDVELRRTLDQVPKRWRGEFATQLRDCERMLGRLGMPQEQRSVAATIQLLGIA